MGKVILYIGMLLTALMNVSAKQAEHPDFMFKLSSVLDVDHIKLKIIEEGQKKSIVIVRSDGIKVPGEVAIEFSYSDKSSVDDKMYRVTGYKFQPLDGDMDRFFGFVRVYTDNLKIQYPQRFVVRKRICTNRLTEFFQCLYEEKEGWSVIVYINNGEINLNLVPVIDEKTEKLIGGAFMVSYTEGTGRYFNKTA